MLTDDELFNMLLSKQKDILNQSIGRRLIEVDRFFGSDLPSFLEGGYFTETEFFSHNPGAIQLHFEGNLTYGLDVYGEQLSIFVLPGTLSSDEFTKLYRLSETSAASPTLKNCLGKTCHDVRIWTLQEDFESEEAKEVAVSYLLNGESEMFYCIYLLEDCDSDYLLLGQDVPRDRVASCFSIALGDYIDPRQ
ncbi:hypothetical protein Cylst_3424 [Cylindrospermum stagnale PCC 7417]|uniref:Uncharacterized protein n=1 Tax=Cylindrospermum stagnale PCC 7417 TaxID=56107 RepID=K9X0J6_9NOST|nr:hypothetical protein [Cylindrospermum stagnale]AFZ25574.1 hypothetical protein Cylst_3424 [Cylindrospermum stagnale PCC 7417]